MEKELEDKFRALLDAGKITLEEYLKLMEGGF